MMVLAGVCINIAKLATIGLFINVSDQGLPTDTAASLSMPIEPTMAHLVLTLSVSAPVVVCDTVRYATHRCNSKFVELYRCIDIGTAFV